MTFGLSFIQLLSISEKRQVMKSNVWLTLSWTDYQLQWRPSHYNGIKAVRIPVDKIWQPDVVRQENHFETCGSAFLRNMIIEIKINCHASHEQKVLMNNADGVLDVIYKPKVVVTFDGTVLWMPPAGKMRTLQQVRLVV